MRRMRSLLLSIGLGAALAGLVLAPVSASYPGKHNGRIAYGVRAADGSSNIFSVHPDGTGQTAAHPRSRQPPLCGLLRGRQDDRLLLRCERLLRDLDDAPGWLGPAPADPPRRLRDLPGLLADGKKVIFGGTEGADEHTEIYAVDATRRERPARAHLLRRLRPRLLQRHCRPGRQMARGSSSSTATTTTRSRTHPVNEQVWVMDATGRTRIRITSGTDPKDQVPDWSPDGSKIAFHAGVVQRRPDLGHGRQRRRIRSS